MTDHPIILSADEVRYFLDTPDRMLFQRNMMLKPQPDEGKRAFMQATPDGRDYPVVEKRHAHGDQILANPTISVGDRLWVREAWSGRYEWRSMRPTTRIRTGSPSAKDVWYWADGEPTRGDWEGPRPSTHMPLWASRITFIVDEVNVFTRDQIWFLKAVATVHRCNIDKMGDQK